MSDELYQQLHDRATRGEELSQQEQKRLEAWYAEFDQAEAADLGSAAASEDSLSARIEGTLAGIAKVAQRIQELDRQTREVEKENSDLRLRLSRRLSTQRA